MHDATIRRATSDEEILACHPVMAELRPHLGAADFLAAVRRMEAQSYRLVFLESAGTVHAVAGYRVQEMLRTGRMLEVDDLVTSGASRSGGRGRQLLRWLLDEARAEGCSSVELDSAVHRADAHRFYFRERMHVLAFHFSVGVSD